MADKLSDTRIRSLPVLEKPRKYPDGTVPGLYLMVSKAGTKLWRLKYFMDGREYLYAIGIYPAIGLKDARDLALKARSNVARRIHPLDVRNAAIEGERQAQKRTFAVVAEDFLSLKTELARSTMDNYLGVLKNHINPVLGKLPVADITVRHVRAMIERMSSTAMARYAFTLVKQVLDFAEENDDVPRNVIAGKKEIKPKHKSVSHKAITKPVPLREFLLRLDAYEGTAAAMEAMRLLTLVPARTVEVACMQWQEIDFTAATWSYTISKTSQDHTAPLSRQALDILRRRLAHSVTGKLGKGYVFPSPIAISKPINPNSILSGVLKGLHYKRGEVTAHGFRATYRSLGRLPPLNIDRVVLEVSLGHRIPGPLGDAYDRNDYIEQRREAAQKWADYLDQLRVQTTDNP